MDWTELVGAILSLWGVWLTMQRKLSSCVIGLVSVVVYGWVFIQARLYSDALLQGVFGVMIVYTWIHWARHLDDSQRVRVAPLGLKPAVLHLALGAVGAAVLGYLMHRYTDAALPWLDSALTSYSLVGQWWDAKRHAATWWMWIAVDTIYVGEYIYKALDITAVLYAVFVLMSVQGLRRWNQAAAKEASTTPEQDSTPAAATKLSTH
ncbi:MAG TPA: nicotinamide riboside transporter PnuC [Rhodanobacteraceae bacterium]